MAQNSSITIQLRSINMVNNLPLMKPHIAKYIEMLREEMKAGEEGNPSDLSRYNILSCNVGLYGKFHCTLILSESIDSKVNEMIYKVGDEVVLHTQSNEGNPRGNRVSFRGVVTDADDSAVKVQLHDDRAIRSGSKKQQGVVVMIHDMQDSTFRLSMGSFDKVTLKVIDAMDELAREGVGHPVAGGVVAKAFREGSSLPPPPPSEVKEVKNREGLNEGQVEAVRNALNRTVSLIHGPPGTGKTTAVVSLVEEAVKQGWRVLVTAPSNVAVDNVLERLDERGVEGMVRLGHTARAGGSGRGRKWVLGNILEGHEGMMIVEDVRKEVEDIIRSMKRKRGGERKEGWRRVKEDRREIRERTDKVVREVVGNAKIVLTTCVGAKTRVMENETFDLVVVDEAGMCLEGWAWVPLLKGRRAVLAGDHLQLPPVVKNPKCGGLKVTLFERMMRRGVERR